MKLKILQFIRNLNRKLGNPAKTILFRYLRIYLRHYFFVKPNLLSQLKLKSQINVSNKLGENRKKILIPMIESSHYQFYHLLGLSKALQLRGADVKVLICDSFLNGCELKSVTTSKVDPCFNCRFNREKTLPLYNLDFIKLSEYISNEEIETIRANSKKLAKKIPKEMIYKEIDIIPMINESVTRYFYGGTSNHNREVVMPVIASHIESAMIGVSVATKIFSDWKPDIVFSNMSTYSTYEPYFRVAEKNHRKYNMITTSEFHYYKKIFNWYELNKSERFFRWVQSRNSEKLSRTEEHELNSFLAKRKSGESDVFVEFDYFGEENNREKLLQINKNKKNFFLFSSIYWDVGLNELNTIYDGMIEWVLDSIEALKDQKNSHLFIKTHPGEYYTTSKSLKTVQEFIKNKYPQLPDNVTIISPEMKIKPYELFESIDIGLVYNGTIGIEMLQHNIPVINSGVAPYMMLDSVTSPKSISGYHALLKGEEKINQVNQKEIQLFSYFYFIKTLIPWTLTKKARDNNFKKYSFDTLDDIMPGNDRYLDHICDCIFNNEDVIPEAW